MLWVEIDGMGLSKLQDQTWHDSAGAEVGAQNKGSTERQRSMVKRKVVRQSGCHCSVQGVEHGDNPRL
eukprot:7752246-Pyramimonas_sp.AAC.1